MLEILVLIIILLFSVIIHEVAHGEMANYLGDPTAKYAGRLTLNPINHLDPIGSILLPALLIITGAGFIIGWAKPVPVNPYNFRDQKYGSAKVGLAGPLANIFLAIFFGLLLRFFPFESTQFFMGLEPVFAFIVFINLLLAVFNLLPIPPLDGSHILFTFLPAISEKTKMILNQYSLFILLFVIFFLFPFIIVFINFLFYLITGTTF